MSKVITLTRARLAGIELEAVRFTLVCSCGLALIAAGRALPF